MKNEISIINEQDVLGKQFKIYGNFEEPLFLAKDVAEWIDYSESNVSKLTNMVDDSEKVRNSITTLGGIQEAWFLTEDGLYEVLMQSRKPIAKQFKKAVKEILRTLRKTGTYKSQSTVPFREQVECIDIIAKSLRVNDASKILMYDTLYKTYNLPANFLPKYEFNGNRELKSATELLKETKSTMSVIQFNKLMIQNGYLEEKTRISSKGKVKKFKALTEKGLKYGENGLTSYNQKEVQPNYYSDTFAELVDCVKPLVFS